MSIKKCIQYITELKCLVCILYYPPLVLLTFCFLFIQISIWSLIHLIDFEVLFLFVSKCTFGWRESMVFDLRKFLTSVCSLSKIAFVCWINNILPLRDPSCIPSKNCFVLNAIPFGERSIIVYLIFSSSLHLCPFASSSNYSSKSLISCDLENKLKSLQTPTLGVIVKSIIF